MLLFVGGFREVEAELDDFEVPVAKAAPEELVDQIRRVVVAVVFEGLIDIGSGCVEFSNDPTRFERIGRARGGYGAERCGIDGDSDFCGAVDVLEEEAGGVPDFVGEGAIAFGSRDVEGDVGARRGHAGEGEADRIRSVLLDDLDGVDDVALGLGHLLAVGVADEGVDVDLLKGDRIGK